MTCFTVLSEFWNTFSFTMRLSFLFNTIHNPSFWTLNLFTFPTSSFIPSFQKEMMKTSFFSLVSFGPFKSHLLHFFPLFLFPYPFFQSVTSQFLSSWVPRCFLSLYLLPWYPFLACFSFDPPFPFSFLLSSCSFPVLWEPRYAGRFLTIVWRSENLGD